MWIPNAASAPGQQVERPQGFDHESIQHVQTREHAAGDRPTDRLRDLEEASNRQEHQPAIHRDPVGTERDDRDEKIKMLMTRIAELEAPQPSSQGSGFMTSRENKRVAEDLIDLNSLPVDQTTEMSHGHHHLPMVEPPPGLDGRVMVPTPIFTLMDFVAPGVPPDGSSSSSSSSSSSTSSSSDRRRKSERKNKKKAKKTRNRSSSSREPTHVKLNNIADKMITPKVKKPDTIKIKDLPGVHAFEPWKFHIRGKIDSNAGRNDEAFEWIMAVEDASISYGDLGDKSAFPSIDAKLADAIQTVSKGHIGKILATSSTEAARRKQRLAGRQLVRLIYNQSAVDEEDGRLFDLEDLMALTCPGDAHMRQFLLTWQDYLNRMATDPGEEVKISIFHKLVKGSDALKVSLNAYDMAKLNSYKRPYDFLKSAAGTHVQNKLRDNSRDALVKASLRNAGNRGVAMLAAAGSSDETPEQVTVSAPAPKAKAKAKAQPCFKYQKGTCDRGDRCPYTHVGEPGSAPELSA